MKFCNVLAPAALLAMPLIAPAAEVVLDARMHHLRSGQEREWSEFAEQAEGSRLAVPFRASSNAGEQTLRLRRINVKHDWSVSLNGKQLARLDREEDDTVVLFPLAPGTLVDGENTVTIAAGGSQSDDVLLGDVRLYDLPTSELTRQATCEVRVVDETGQPIPCRITVVDQNGSWTPLGAESSAALAVRNGVIYSGDGAARFGVMAGTYTIYAGRGFEYSVDSAQVTLEAGETATRKLQIRREVDTSGYVACDTHVHTVTFSGHGDCSIDERMLTIAGEGLELPIATDHNTNIDYEPFAEKSGMRSYFTPVIGNEVTTRLGHFNVFPIDAGAAPPDFRAESWRDIFQSIYATPGVRIVILNHGRDIHGGFRPFDPKNHNSVVGENLNRWRLEANAMELVNSAALQTDVMRLYHDWFGLLNRGHSITPIGSSDSHEVARKTVAQGRTYVQCDDSNPGAIDVAAACKSIQEGRVLVSMGLLAEIAVNGKYGPGDLAPINDDVAATITVRGPSWVSADRVRLFANGVLVREEEIDSSRRAKDVLWRGKWSFSPPDHDVHLVAVATGPGVTKAYWPIPRTYQPTSPVWAPYVVGSTGAVWIDVDGDGKRTSAYDVAGRLVRETEGDLADLMRRLAECDEAVAAQAASLLSDQGKTLLDDDVMQAVSDAAPATQRGFRRFFEAWRASQAVRGA